MPQEILQIGSWSGNQISLDPAKISASSGLEYPRLIIPVRLDLNPIKESSTRILNYTIFCTNAELFLEPKHLKISDLIAGSYPYKVIAERLYTIYNLEFPLTYKRISKIETERIDNLTLQLIFHFTIGIFEQNFISTSENSNVQMRFEIEQSYWVKNILPALNYGEYFIIEIPKENKTINGAWLYIEKADKYYKMWNHKGTIVECREMGVLLNKVIQEKLLNNPNLEKWERSYSKYFHFVSLFLHTEDPKTKKIEGNINVTKNDAEHILFNAKLLLKYAENLLSESN